MRRYHTRRYGAIIAAILLAAVVLYTTEPRRRAYSCKTLGSCIDIIPHTYSHRLPRDPALREYEETLADGAVHYTRELFVTRSGGTGTGTGADSAAMVQPNLLILVLNKDESSWARDFRATGRSVHDFLDLLLTTKLDLATVSLGMMTSSQAEFAAIKQATSKLPFGRVSILLKTPGSSSSSSPGQTATTLDYKDRHDRSPKVQRKRRGIIAALRNYLMLRTLADEEHILWVDADVAEFSPGIVQAMLAHAAARPGDVGLITARCSQNAHANYDKNAWSVDKGARTLWSPVVDGMRGAAVDELVRTRKFVDVLLLGGGGGEEEGPTSDADLVPLDSVGGTILYIRASMVREGLSFPTFNVVGTTWSHEGWVGVETEGICYVAAQMAGGGGRCWLLGGSHAVRHADWG
ncbi:Anp1-domain-containing protein [Microdochium trichocladiopsis]|uniref:Anp1-domain-containing protein n=1 Tax=Microdochium trichocladiopsis TaxID=1682393 RepID=A0A9P9BUC7_9PEZI|nr:Anp1-domain-containing protein [Microdochium trichocladiopsis]KAH7037334.1 Anp1-domain-containing protein [Microdochium trichocladiopsis]